MSIIQKFSGGFAPSPRGQGHDSLNRVGNGKRGDPCERSEWATENGKFTVSEEILIFLVLGESQQNSSKAEYVV